MLEEARRSRRTVQAPNHWLFSAERVSSLPERLRLDLQLVYLLFVHNFCWYCSDHFETAAAREFRCPGLHRRSTMLHLVESTPDHPVDALSSAQSEASRRGENWHNALVAKVEHRMKDPPRDIAVVSGSNLMEERESEWRSKQIIKLEADKWRCGVCSKPFRGPDFVGKHLSNKHADEIQQVRRAALSEQFLDNFLADPNRCQPARPAAAFYGRRGGFPDLGHSQGTPHHRFPPPQGGGGGLLPGPSNPAVASMRLPLAPLDFSGDMRAQRGLENALRTYQDLDAPVAPALPDFSKVDYDKFFD